MKKLISLLLSAIMIVGTMATTVLADEPSASVAMYLKNASYNSNQAVLALTIEGIEADSYTYQWYHASAEAGPYTPMYKETNATYVLSSDDYATYMRCEITPITGGVAGSAFTSSVYYLAPSRGAMRFTSNSSDVKDNPSANKVTIAGQSILILDEYADSFYVITDDFKGWHKFDETSDSADDRMKFRPTVANTLGYYLNNDLLTGNTIPAA